MLMDKYGRKNMLAFWKEKGTTAIFTANNNWGITNANDASIYMSELYRFYMENEEYGTEVMNNFLNADPKFIKGKNNYKVANKSGWSGTAIHDISIVFADNPYVVVALSNLGATDYYMSYFNKANDFAYRLHTEYWKYKMNLCNNIEQY
jgi:beta-lactamase class A